VRILQALLADYPTLLTGEPMDSSEPRRWLLIRREAPVPSGEGSGRRWSRDHLSVDQDAVPTVVEVKRSTDTRLRREVVGRWVANWPIEHLQAQFQRTCQGQGLDPDKVLAEFVPGEGLEEFRSQMKTNLQAGRIRMVFVAVVIPPELLRSRRVPQRAAGPGRGVSGGGQAVHRWWRPGDRASTGGSDRPYRPDQRSGHGGGSGPAGPFLDAMGESTPSAVPMPEALLGWAAERGLRIEGEGGMPEVRCRPSSTSTGSCFTRSTCSKTARSPSRSVRCPHRTTPPKHDWDYRNK